MIFKSVYCKGLREFLFDRSLPFRVEEIRIVGTQHRDDMRPYPLVGHVEVRPEPNNPYDKHALAVYHSDQHIGYVGRDKQHYFIGSDKQTPVKFKQNSSWDDLPKFVTTNDAWSLFILLP